MRKIDLIFQRVIRKFILSLLIIAFSVFDLLGQQSVPSLNVALTQDFNTLASSLTSSTLPSGWFLSETGSNNNTTYTAGTGSSGTGDTYSFGAAGNSERAIGGVRAGNLNPTFGAAFTNNTGSVVSCILINYTGEQWRLGATSREDKLDFQYSINATALNNGTWIDENSLDFIAPVQSGSVGALVGNNSANKTAISYTITGLNIANGSNFWIRWSDFDANTADDGLGVDDFSITFLSSIISLSTNNLSGLNYTLGSGPSTYQSFNVSSTSLTGFPGNITLNAPANFEISLTPDGPYSSSVNIPYTSATLASTPVYVQLAAGLSAGSYNGAITMTGGGSTCTPSISLSGTVASVCASTVSISSFNPTTATAGNTVTVTGVGFTGATSVSLSSVNVSSYTVVDDNTITFNVPPNSSTGKITVNVGSCSAVSTNNLIISSTANIKIKTQFVNPCGPDANNEFIIANTLSETVNIANIGLTSSNGTDINWYWGGKNLPVNPYPTFSSGASEACGASGLGCFGFLDPNNATDAASINTIISNLNTIAGCNVFLAVPPDGNIPPSSNVIFLLGAGGCGLYLPSSYLNFTNHCSSGAAITQYFVVIGTGNIGCNGGGYFSNSESRASTIFNFMGSSYQSQTSAYSKPPSVPTVAPATFNTTQAAVLVPDGRGGSKWVNNNGCIPLPNILLSELKFDFHSLNINEVVELNWNFKAGEPIKEFIVEKSNDHENFSRIATIPVFQYDLSEVASKYTDIHVGQLTSFYRIKAISYRGSIYFSSINKIITQQKLSILHLFPNPAKECVYVTNRQKRILSYDLLSTTGRGLIFGKISNETNKIQLGNIPPGMYLIRFFSENGETIQTEKIFKQ